MKSIKKSMSLFMIVSILNITMIAPIYSATVQVQSGVYIQLELTQSIDSDDASNGQSINFRVTSPLIQDGKIVVAAGSTARGVVESVDGAGILGSEGELGISLKSVTAVDGTQIPISASKFVKGKDKSITAIIIGLFLCFPFLFMKGGEAELQSGSYIEAMVVGSPNVEID